MCEDIWKLQNVNVTKWEVSIILLRKLYELSMGVVHVDVHRQSWLFEVVKPSFEQNGPMERGHPPESPSCRCPSEFGSKKTAVLSRKHHFSQSRNWAKPQSHGVGMVQMIGLEN